MNNDRPENRPPIYLRARDIAGAAGLLGISRSQFYALVSEGKLSRPLKCGRISLWNREQLLREFEELVK